MNIPDLNDLQNRIHLNNMAKGWLPPDAPARSWEEQRALIVSEISEALEHWREGRVGLWWHYRGLDMKASDKMTPEAALEMAQAGHKPDGLPIEIADVVYRCLDWTGQKHVTWVSLRDAWFLAHAPDGGPEMNGRNVPGQLDYIMSHLFGGADIIERCRRTIAACVDFADQHKFDLWAMVELKHAYNKTREYRHGGKKA